jgi:hypothetical protein
MYNNSYNNNNNSNFVLGRGEVLLLTNLITMYQSNNNVLVTLGNDNTLIINSLLSTNNRISSAIIDMFSQRHRRQERRNNHLYFTDILGSSNPSMNSVGGEPQNADLLRLFTTFLEPIEIHPTSAQIEDATRVVRFGDIINPINDSCPISLNAFHENDNVTIIRQCGHVFNTTELNNWFLGNCRCPVCRHDIRTNTTASTVTDLSSNVIRSTINYRNAYRF